MQDLDRRRNFVVLFFCWFVVALKGGQKRDRASKSCASRQPDSIYLVNRNLSAWKKSVLAANLSCTQTPTDISREMQESVVGFVRHLRLWSIHARHSGLSSVPPSIVGVPPGCDSISLRQHNKLAPVGRAKSVIKHTPKAHATKKCRSSFIRSLLLIV